MSVFLIKETIIRDSKQHNIGQTIKDHELSYEDILHYQKIIVDFTETDRLMKEVYKIEIE